MDNNNTDNNNSNLRSRPPPLTLVRANLEKIDAELSRCHQQVEGLELKKKSCVEQLDTRSQQQHHIT